MESKEGSARTRSSASCSTKRSNSSSTVAAATMARAKAEAVKARLQYAEKEMDLKVEEAQLEAKMSMLSLQQEMAAAVAEAEVLEAAVDGSDRVSSKPHSVQLGATPLDPTERTKEYVAEQAREQNKVQFAPEPQQTSQTGISLYAELASLDPIQNPHLNIKCSQANADFFSSTPYPKVTTQPQLTPETHLYSTNRQENHHSPGERSRNPSPPFPSTPRDTPQNSYHEQSNMTDLIRYFARRELVTTGMIQFNDQPQSYRAWKWSFKNVVRGLDMTASKEMDLLPSTPNGSEPSTFSSTSLGNKL